MRATAHASGIHKQQQQQHFDKYPAAKVRDSRKSTRPYCAWVPARPLGVCACVWVSAVSIFVLICHFSSFMSIWICCSAKRWPWNFHATTNDNSASLPLSLSLSFSCSSVCGNVMIIGCTNRDSCVDTVLFELWPRTWMEIEKLSWKMRESVLFDNKECSSYARRENREREGQ